MIAKARAHRLVRPADFAKKALASSAERAQGSVMEMISISVIALSDARRRGVPRE
jgi:hypothetical protein